MAAPKPVPKPEPKDKKPDTPPEHASPAPKPRRRKVILLIVVATALVLAATGGAAWYFTREKGVEDTAKAAPAPKPKSEKPKQAIFVPLETFTVNLQPEAGDRYLQTTLSLKVGDAAVEQAIKQQMPEIRSRLLLLLSSKRASELTSVEGKQALANQIAAQVNRVLNPEAAPAPPPTATKAPEPAAAPADGKAPDAPATAPQETAPEGPVLSVLFTNFIIQ
jgi:flagellar FliL protein